MALIIPFNSSDGISPQLGALRGLMCLTLSQLSVLVLLVLRARYTRRVQLCPLLAVQLRRCLVTDYRGESWLDRSKCQLPWGLVWCKPRADVGVILCGSSSYASLSKLVTFERPWKPEYDSDSLMLVRLLNEFYGQNSGTGSWNKDSLDHSHFSKGGPPQRYISIQNFTLNSGLEAFSYSLQHRFCRLSFKKLYRIGLQMNVITLWHLNSRSFAITIHLFTRALSAKSTVDDVE